MTHSDSIYTKSPIVTYLAVASIFVGIAAIVKLIMAEPAIETRKVVIDGRDYAYQVREGEEQDTLTHMVKTYGNMVIANQMNKQCVYLTPLDTTTLDENTKRFGELIEEIIKDDDEHKQHIASIMLKNLNARYECGAIGRSTVEHYTHASRAIAAGFDAY